MKKKICKNLQKLLQGSAYKINFLNDIIGLPTIPKSSRFLEATVHVKKVFVECNPKRQFSKEEK